jgi:hypothetical protein
MIFNHLDPFPLLPDGSYSYSEAQEHAQEVDAYLGLKTEEIEDMLLQRGMPRDRELWIGLPVKSLLTPYAEIRSVLAKINPEPGSTVVDLGAGYGRMAFVIGAHHPNIRFVGYEYVLERVREAQRCLAKFDYRNVEMIRADLAAPDFELPDAQTFFIYDFGRRAEIEKTLQDLRALARTRNITVVGRGRATRDLIEKQHPWLSDVVVPLLLGNTTIYRSA